MATPHIAAAPGDFAPAVLMPGDPKRAQRIAEILMADARMITDVRGMLGFTGTVNGKPLSVMGSGMGQPSFTIYATELFSQFGVERIIRVGTIGAISPKVEVGDVILVNRLKAQKGETVEFPVALVVDGANVILGAKDLAKLSVKAEVINDEAKGPKINIMKYKNKTGVARRKGHRQQLTAVKITAIA